MNVYFLKQSNMYTSKAKKVVAAFLISLLLWTSWVSAARISTNVIQNVVGSKNYSGIEFSSAVTGVVWARYYEDGKTFEISATYARLPATPAWYFYEGWIVDKKTGDLISAGIKTNVKKTGQSSKKQKNNTNRNNDVILKWDFRSYDHYVLTLEKDDGNPAPSDFKILEGDYKITTLRGVKRDEFKPSSTATIWKNEAVVVHEKAPIVQGERTLADVVTKESVIKKETARNNTRSRIQTAQQKFLEKKIEKFDRKRLQKIKSNMPTIKARFSGRSDVLAIIDDIELVIDEILWEPQEANVEDIINELFQ